MVAELGREAAKATTMNNGQIRIIRGGVAVLGIVSAKIIRGAYYSFIYFNLI